MNRLQRALRDREGGFTLAEMLVVVSLLTLVLGIAMGTLIQSQKTVRGSNQRLNQTQQAKTAVESMTKMVRTAVLPSQVNGNNTDLAAFLSADWNKVSFYANVNNQGDANGPSKVTYELKSNGDLVETVQPSSGKDPGTGIWTYCTPGPGCTVKTRTVARNVVNTSAKPLFVYYSVSQPNGMATPLTATTLPSVNSVDIMVTVKSGIDVVASSVVTRVSLPNANAIINDDSNN